MTAADNWKPPRDNGWVYPLLLFVCLIAWMVGSLSIG